MAERTFLQWIRGDAARADSFTVSESGAISFDPQALLRSPAAIEQVRCLSRHARAPARRGASAVRAPEVARGS